MTIQPGDPMRLLLLGVRRVVAARAVLPQRDRNLAAVTLIGAAIVVAWPRGRQVPPPIGTLADLGRHIYQRRTWWTPTE